MRRCSGHQHYISILDTAKNAPLHCAHQCGRACWRQPPPAAPVIAHWQVSVLSCQSCRGSVYQACHSPNVSHVQPRCTVCTSFSQLAGCVSLLPLELLTELQLLSIKARNGVPDTQLYVSRRLCTCWLRSQARISFSRLRSASDVPCTRPRQ
jgi:hypothetical protein